MQIPHLSQWLSKRSKREQLFIFIGGFVLIYLFYYILCYRPIHAQKKYLIQTMTSQQAQKATIMQEISKINQLINDPVFLQMIREQKRLTSQIENAEKQLVSLKPKLVTSNLVHHIINKIVGKRSNVKIISLDELPGETWSKEELKDTLTHEMAGIYQHKLQIDFQDDYFGTVRYLNRLENISEKIYWDSMNYQVLKYPKAEVVISFHLLSLQKD